MKFVAKYFPEIIMKSRPVRKRLLKQLQMNVRNLVGRNGFKADVQGQWDNLYVGINSEDPAIRRAMINILTHTPGIAFSYEIEEHDFDTMDDAYQIIKAVNGPSLAGKTFCVRVKRRGDHEYNSNDVERYIGGGLLKETDAIGVKLKNPDITVQVEIRDQLLFAIKHRFEGIGGYPLGSQGDTLSLISGGFDSSVASYMMMKRGIKTHYCFFNLGGSAHEVGVKQVAYYLWDKYGASHKARFISVPFEGVVKEILENVADGHMGVVLKRMMYRAAEQVADSINLETFVTGESIAQVSSQTLTNLAVIDKVTDKLVLRPLIVMDKPEIISLARKIGTETFAATMPEYCGVISVKPTTEAKMTRVLAEEANFDLEVLNQAVKDSTHQYIGNLVKEENDSLEVACISLPSPSDIIVDIRHPNEVEDAPLDLNHNDIITMPFYEIGTRKDEFKAEQTYLFYCQKGTMSKIHAHHLNSQGMKNIKVYLEEKPKMIDNKAEKRALWEAKQAAELEANAEINIELEDAIKD
ncbi:MAG: tRNA 4-thiouridine(8) synthase ThiI [Oleispira antarctica]|uniref:Probable tRNA sulfurtransferase n=1 Tax=Oleispira antarctica RB-8 TaxID=698738 RepID=R4YMC7_OLEAN|nr:tRNA 4-thiouridine(8) synthase ThiI [Oleispira antarctica]MBQ0791287.1 tRNA 4-thiouridine(8) synthase ThiI [Oleispira antarctica]CCK76091.1 Thiamine biosynthesis protein ThiI [Oleispira antarctica RB-8]